MGPSNFPPESAGSEVAAQHTGRVSGTIDTEAHRIDDISVLTGGRPEAANEGDVAAVRETPEVTENLDTRRLATEDRVARVISFGDGVKRLKAKKKDAERRAKGIPKRRREDQPRLNGLTDEKSPTITKIAAGKITKVSVAAAKDSRLMNESQGKLGLAAAVEISGALNMPALTMKEAAAKLFALTQAEGAEAFDEMSRDQKFNAVAGILVRVWQTNYRNRLNDRRIGDCIRMVAGKEPVAKLLGLLSSFATMPVPMKSK
ncbi:hypothetical protein IT413_03080 [Candidatus Peregrinibacteria bacterium]|nr:hypothetical protein [Candidatus Peregrinibacteria bacterium]